MAFDDFVEREGIDVYKGGGVKCWTCALAPEVLVEIRELRGRTPAVPYRAIAEYLQADHKLKITPGAIQKHFQNGHK
jgi:hypothetical protein